MLVTSDKGCLSCLKMCGGKICQHVDFFCPFADFFFEVIFLILFRSNHCSQMSFTFREYLNIYSSKYRISSSNLFSLTINRDFVVCGW